jgi:glycosyltransferase involved in cell wall biosynthesis
VKNGNFLLLIHHHHPFYLDENGRVWLSSAIGRWVNALSLYMEIGLLLYQSHQKLSQQDTLVDQRHVHVYSLGARKSLHGRWIVTKKYREVCFHAGKEADALLIRGITPHQHSIWRHVDVDRKAFLLVGSLAQIKQTPRSIPDVLSVFLHWLHIWELKKFAREQTLMLANSPVLTQEIENKLHVPARFIPTSSISSKELTEPFDKPVQNPCRLLYCGRLDLQKGLVELINATAVLRSSGWNCQLDIVGEKTNPVYAELQNLSEQLGIAGHIHWHGFVHYGDALFDLYRQADVFVLPTYTEGFPRTIWEAAAHCAPIVTTSVGGIPAMLENGKHCLLVPPMDRAALAAAIQRMLENDPLRQRIINNAYQLVQEYTVESCAKKMASILMSEWGLNGRK